jgi:amino acid adenylation domain-containing protein
MIMTLTDVLTRAATIAPGQGVVHVGSADRFTGYAELFADALRIGGGLRDAGLRPGDPLLVAADDGADFLGLFWGAIVAGVVPVPLPPEPRRLAAVHRHLGGPPFAGDIAAPGGTLLSSRDLRSAFPLQNPHPVRPDDLAFLQFSSGSTGTPKGVELTHANVVANLEQATRTGALTPADVVVTWMPYFHDMGLIGTHLAPLYSRCRQVRISPLAFAKRPATWLRTATRHRATVLSAANFALALVNRRVPDEVLDELDLSTVRLLMVGAEPISPSVWHTFETRLRRSGLAPGAMQPVYGLAEATVAVACPPLGEPATPLRLSRAALSRGVALPVPPPPPTASPWLPASTAPPVVPASGALPAVPADGAPAVPPVSGAPLVVPETPVADPSVVLVMDVGHPVPGCELRIVDESGAVLEDGLVGHLQVRGPNVTRGYHRDPDATAAARDGEWLRTGDIGFLRAGRLCVTGRHKDVLFINGRNFHAADLEEVAAATPGLAPGPIAVVGATDPADGREVVAVYIAAPAVRPDPATLPGLIRSRVAEALAHDNVRAEVVPTGTFARTTSGKLRRQPLRDRLTTLPPTPEPARPHRPGPTPLDPPSDPSPLPKPTAGSGETQPDLPGCPSPLSQPRGDSGEGQLDLDQGALPLPPRAGGGGEGQAGLSGTAGVGAPLGRTEAERVVRGIWARVLNVPAATIGPDDRFLAIGGSSLKAMEVLAELEDAFGRTLDPVLLRDCATVPALADRLLAAGPAAGRDSDDPGSVPGARVVPDVERAADGRGLGGLAVIGMACRFPDADSPAEFWENLLAGRDSVTPVTRWAGGGHGAFLADPASFDAGYFGIGETEARLLDPHARIFLELAHEALERAGFAGPRRKNRRIGVFAAVGESAYPELVTGAGAGTAGGSGDGAGAYALTGGLRNLIAARVAHLLDLRGPALAVDTACSSALVALHLARLSLAAGDCDIAVVGGVSLNLTATGEALLGAAQALSPTGRSRAFSADADGFVPGEGGAALVLMRLADAADETVLAVVRGTAVNNDGRSLSLMAPNPLLQREVIADAYRDSGVDPADVTYVEAHGTGTAVGDPIEARSLAYAFPPRPDGRPRLLGSVKTNIGHLLNVAGLPALVKVILAVQHRELPPSLHYDRPSPRFDLAAAGFEVVTERRPWTGPLVAGVNGFGFGGTNAHVIVAAAPGEPAGGGRQPDDPVAEVTLPGAAEDGRPHLLTLSARSAEALEAAAGDLAAHLRAHPGLRMADVCASVAAARDDGPYRIALLTGSDLPMRLVATEAGPPLGRPARVAFLFGGQGTQRPGQGAELYATAPVFRAVLDEVSAAAGPVAGRTLVAWCTDPEIPVTDLARTEVTQPLVVAFGVAQAAQLAAYGVRPEAVAGHSIGEFAAAVSTGRLTAVEAVLLAVERGRLTAALAAPGAMLAVAASEADVTALLSAPDVTSVVSGSTAILGGSAAGVVVAAENAADRVVLAGSHAAIDAAAARLARHGVVSRRLAVSHAFHSPAMAPVAEALARLTQPARPGTIPLVSTVTGEWDPAFDGDYLAAHATRPVRFAAAADRLRAAGFDTMVEVGGSVTLSSLVRGTPVLPAGRDAAAMLSTAGDLWLRGVPLDRSRLDAGTRRITLPTYPFQRRRHWITDTSAPSLSRPMWTESALPAPGPAAAVTVLVAGSGDAAEALTAIRSAPAGGRLLVITRDLYATGPERPDAAHAVWAGLAMAFADENPRAGVRIVDLRSADPDELRRTAVEQESATPPEPGPAEIVAWRAGRRLTRSFTPVEAGDPLVPPPDGDYLIVGGAGAVGAAIARHLARRGRPRLLLAGRSAEPVALLDELRRLGATAQYRVTDITVAEDVAALVAGRDFDVVIQAAGTVRPGSLRARTAGEVTAGLAAKVRGTTLLSHALGDRRPLVVALSSVSSVLPGLAGAVGDYVAANLFLDSFAAAERAAGRRFVAVNLPALTGGGLAAAHTLSRPAGGSLPIEQVPETLWAAAALGVAQVLVTPPPAAAGHPPGPALASMASFADDSPGRAVPPVESGTGHEVAPKVSGPHLPGRDALVAVVRELLAGPLEREPGSIGVDEPFLALGLDSLTAVDLVKELEQRLGRTLSTTLFFEHRTIGELAGHLVGPERTVFPLSPVQRAFVTTGRLYPEVPAYAYVRQTLAGPVDAARLAAAFAELERRHPMLRMRIGPDGQYFVPPTTGNPDWFTVLDPEGPPAVPQEGSEALITGVGYGSRAAGPPAVPEAGSGALITGVGYGSRAAGPPAVPGAGSGAAIAGLEYGWRGGALDGELRNRVFDLEREGPVRAVLVVVGAELAHLIVVAHHAAADGYSLAILGDELWALYDGTTPAAAPERTFMEHEAARPAATATDIDHWRATLAASPRLRLPYDGTGDGDGEPEGPYAVHQRVVETGVSERLTATARAAGVSVFHLLLAGYVRCLARWTGQDTVPVSVARAGRTARLPGVERIVGPFADTLPVLAETRPGESAVALAERLRELWLTAERHGSVSTVDLARMLAAGGAGPRTASPASFSFARFPGAGRTGANVLATTAGTATAATRLGLVCFEAHGTLHFSWNYPEALFRPETVERFAAEHLAEITALAEGAAGEKIAHLAEITAPAEGAVGEKTAPLAEITAPTGESPGGRTVVDRIREQCRRTPGAIAVLTDGVALTYRDLDLASDRLARRLAAAGALRIGLLTSPGADSVIGVVGILKAGAAWVPMDAAHPPARLAGLLGRAGASVVVCDEGTREAADELARRGFGIVETAADGPDPMPVIPVKSDDTAYVIFTSGSTGRPKGVPVGHRAMIGYLDWAISAFGYREGDRLAQTASICFDASVRQLLAPLLVGATVVAWDRDTVRDPELLLERLVRDRVTVWSSVPTLWERLLTAAERTRPRLSLRWVHVGGEELSPAHVRRWFDLFGPEQRITNLYGPTETTINATWYAITARPADDVTRLPIGRPVGGAVVEVTDASGRPCADGDIGEIWIGGTGLADGYLDDPEQTAAVFVERDGRRWYRSGDLGVRDSDGLLWFRGRADDQVKLHGYRIEPGEVEAVLRQHPGVERAVVAVEDGRLVARVQSSSVDASALRAHLSALLPDYLVPGRITMTGELPLTATGKIDRASLRGGGEPVTPTERLLAELWSRQLRVPVVRREDDFFLLGGDSIGVLELFASLGEHRADLPRPTVVYRHRTLAELAAVIDATVTGPPGVRTGDGDFPVTLTQRGFLLADAVGAPPTWLAAPRLHGPLDPQRFQRAVDVLVARHPMLRTVFPSGMRPPVQRELSGKTMIIGYEPSPRLLDEELAAEREHRFDPSTWPLVRLRLLRYAPDEHVLLIHAHHLVGDGYSVALLMRELVAVHDGAEPEPLRATFRDYVALLDSVTPEVAPHDGGPLTAGGQIATTGFTIDAGTVAALREQAAAAGVTPFVPVLAAYHRALATVSGRPDPAIGVAVTGRDHSLPDVGRIFGPCATAVAVRPGAGAGLSEVAAAVADARNRTFTAPQGWQHFFTYLDFGALGPVEGATLTVTWDDADAELAVPPGTEVLLAVRPVGGGLRMTLRVRHPHAYLDRLKTVLLADLEQTGTPSHAESPTITARAGSAGGSHKIATRGRAAAGTVEVRPLDAGLVGYLPAPAQWTGLPEDIRRMLPRLDRETVRRMVFPGGRPRLLEITETRLGRSGFIALPRFADELGESGLAEHAAAAVDLAADRGARTVSLAGMIPAGTGYGTAVLPYIRSETNLTTGHAVTAAAVVRTVLAALAAQDRKLGDGVVAVLGMGSIGTSSLSLLLARGEPPAGLILCDLPAAAARLTALAEPWGAEVATTPEAVYRADVIVAATSSGPGTLDVDRLKPGTILVDDSFPHCFDTGRALARMRDRGDVLIVGGGLLACGETRHEMAEGLPDLRHQLPGSMASCRLESLLHATVPGLPLVHGPVTPEHAAAYWDALDAAGVGAAPLHLLNERLDPEGHV